MKQSDKTWLILSLTCFLTAFFLWMGQLRTGQEALAARIAPAVLRFHILANSDSDRDQSIKLEIRSLILDYMKNHRNPDADKAETGQWILDHRRELEDLADRKLKDQGFLYAASLTLENDYFPAKNYGTYTFPCGRYDALRIVLGKGQGHNWWCILYPSFCFVDGVCEKVPDNSRDTLRRELKQGDYLALEDHRPEIHLKLFSSVPKTLQSFFLTPPSPDHQ